MSTRSLIQMSGPPGAGKSTIAGELSRRHGMVAIDHDLVKSALLEGGGSFADAGRTSYGLVTSLAESLLAQGHTVIIDSPCFYAELLDNGQAIARRQQAQYLYLECRLADLDEIDRRLAGRTPLRSQRPSVDGDPVDVAADGRSPGPRGREQFQRWLTGMHRPADGYLLLDTSRDVESCMQDVEMFLRHRKAIG